MPKPDALNKDFAQTLKESYDPALERLRVDALITDGIDAMVINPDGSINTTGTITLPAGAATEAKQDAGNLSLDNIDNKTPPLGQTIMDNSTPVTIASDQTPLTIQATSLPLPTNAATEATLAVLEGKVPSNLTVVAARLQVDGSGVTQPVSDGGGSLTVDGSVSASQSGTWNINDISGTISLPTGASTSALQTTGNTSLDNIDNKLRDLTTTASGTLTAATQSICLLNTEGATSITARATGSWSGLVAIQGSVDGTNFQLVPIFEYGTRSSQLYISTNDNAHALIGGFRQVRLYAVSMSGTANFNVTLNAGIGPQNIVNSNPAALYATVNIRDGNSSAFTKGQKTMSDSLPVVISSDQTAVPASQSGTWNINNVSGTVSLPTGASTSALQTTGNNSLSSIDGKIPSNLTVSSTRLLVDGSGVTQPVSDGGGSLTVDGTVAATQSGSWVLGSNSGVDIGDVTINNTAGAGAVNIQDGGNSITVDGTVAATQSGTWNINDITGSISLPTGAATSALQTTGNNSLSSIDGKLNSLGQKTMANSMPVVIASDQTVIPVSDNGGSITTDNTSQGSVGAGTAGTTSDLVGAVYNTTLPTLTDGQQAALQVNSRARLITEEWHPTMSSVTSVSGSATNVTLLSANSDRQGAFIFNDSNATLYVKLGTTASATSYTVKLAKDQLFELPHPCYNGQIDGIWSSATGAARITELT